MSELLSVAPTAVRIIVTGRVQGVGFRPAIARLAAQLSLAGAVCNTNNGVEITLEGNSAAIDEFQQLLSAHVPPRSKVDRVEVCPASAIGRSQFEILPSGQAGRLATPPPLDMAVCRECLAEVDDPEDRRFEYGFTSCAQCGPRYSIVQSLPYERRATSMTEFELCRNCRDEYENPADRRFHAETIGCPRCGPRCWLANSSGSVVAEQHEAIAGATAALRRGQIVALRSIGGYQLLVVATRDDAVRRLRERKRRPAKPLAVLVYSLEVARSLARIDATAAAALTQPAGSIVVVPARHESPLAASVYPGLREVGLMLPTSPLHWSVARMSPPLVATSGNLEAQPLEYDSREAHGNLASIADYVLDHDRPIVRPIDDSVVKLIAGKPVTLRLARGLAPLQLELGSLESAPAGRCVLAVGGQQNNAIAVSNGCQAVLGPHVGDLDELMTCQRWHQQRRELCSLLDAEAALIVHDLHPDYYTTRWAMESGVTTLGVQHHHAHIATAMLEHGWLDREVLGVAWDGTGWGPDGTIWGGEFLRATAAGFRRIARLRPFSLPGGEAAIREPWRVALVLLAAALSKDDAVEFLAQRGWAAESLSKVLELSNRPGLSPQTSSVGRLFDAVATIALPRDFTAGGRAQFEGQLAMFLESACEWPAASDKNDDGNAYELPLVLGDPAELDWRPLVAGVVGDCRAAIAPATIARRFHAALASAVAAVSATFAELPVVLGGGVFQNRVLTELIVQRFSSQARRLGLPGAIPPGDGGLAAGQLAVALAQLGRGLSCV